MKLLICVALFLFAEKGNCEGVSLADSIENEVQLAVRSVYSPSTSKREADTIETAVKKEIASAVETKLREIVQSIQNSAAKNKKITEEALVKMAQTIEEVEQQGDSHLQSTIELVQEVQTKVEEYLKDQLLSKSIEVKELAEKGEEIPAQLQEDMYETLTKLSALEGDSWELATSVVDRLNAKLRDIGCNFKIDLDEVSNRVIAFIEKLKESKLSNKILGQQELEDKFNNFDKEIKAMVAHSIHQRALVDLLPDFVKKFLDKYRELRDFFLTKVKGHVANVKALAQSFLLQVPGVSSLLKALTLDEEALAFFGPYKEKLGAVWCRLLAVYNKTVALFRRLHPLNVLNGTAPTPEPLPQRCQGKSSGTEPPAGTPESPFGK